MAKTKSAGSSSAHSRLVNEILREFGAEPGMMLRKNATGQATTPDGATVRYGQPGSPDIVGTWRRDFTVRRVINPGGFQPHETEVEMAVGHSLAIEVKTGRAKLSSMQRKWRDAFEAVGGLYVLARRVADVREALDDAAEGDS